MIIQTAMRLYQNSCGTWCVGMAGNVRRSLKTKDKALAERIFRTLKREALLGNVVAIDRSKTLTLSAFATEYQKYCETRKRKSTALRDKYSVNKLIDFIGGSTILSSISNKRAEEFVGKLISAGHKPVGVNTTLGHLKAAFAMAVKWGYLKSSPFSAVKKVKTDPNPPRFYSEDELKRIFAAINDPDFHDLITVYVMTGIRRSELSGLRGKNIDFKQGIISVNGKTGWRHIPMTEQINEIMDRRIKSSGITGKIFPKWNPDSISHKWIKLMKKLGIAGRLHDLRHTTASYLVMAGVDLRTIQTILGHSDISTTTIYAHLTQDYARDALSKLNNLHKISTRGNLKIVISND